MCLCRIGFESINPTNPCMGLICLILNCILPGTGTILNGCCGANCCSCIIWGILQILTIPLLLFGWVWSICYGLEIYRVACGGRTTDVHVIIHNK